MPRSLIWSAKPPEPERPGICPDYQFGPELGRQIADSRNATVTLPLIQATTKQVLVARARGRDRPEMLPDQLTRAPMLMLKLGGDAGEVFAS